MARTPERRHDRADDAGFTLVEVVVAVAVIAVVMLGLGAVFVATAAGTDAQGSRQTAVRIATDGLDRVRALPAASLASSLPAAPQAVTVDGLTYTRSYRVSPCALTSGGTCATTGTTGTVPVSTVVVSVAWNGKGCSNNRCTYQLSTMVDAGTVDPVFDANDAAAAPVVNAISDVVQDVGENVLPVVTAVGGAGRLTYAASGQLPGDVRLTRDGAFTGLTGVLPTSTVTVTVSDEFGQSSSTTFTWTVNPLPTLTAATVPVTATVASAPIDLATALELTGGTAPYTWSCGSLPTGIALTGGTLTATVPAVGTARLPCTATDARSRSANATLTLSVLPKLTITAPVNGSSAAFPRATGVSVTAVAAGCSASCSWTATGLPTGVSLDAATGRLTGRPAVGRYTVTLTVTDVALRTAVTTVTWIVA